jgi:hypothetical protein
MHKFIPKATGQQAVLLGGWRGRAAQEEVQDEWECRLCADGSEHRVVYLATRTHVQTEIINRFVSPKAAALLLSCACTQKSETCESPGPRFLFAACVEKQGFKLLAASVHFYFGSPLTENGDGQLTEQLSAN